MSGVTEKDFMEIGFDIVNKHRFSNRKSYKAKAEEYKTHFGCGSDFLCMDRIRSKIILSGPKPSFMDGPD